METFSIEQYSARVKAWNEQRNGLELSVNLEARLFAEELAEFMTAETPAEMLHELADLMFVSAGTEAKKHNVPAGSPDRLFTEDFTNAAAGMADVCCDLMARSLALAGVPEDDWEGLFQAAMMAVLEANEAKGTEKDEGGKVVKGDAYVSPLETIKALLEPYNKESVA